MTTAFAACHFSWTPSFFTYFFIFICWLFAVHALVQTEAASHRHWKRDWQLPIIIPIEYFAISVHVHSSMPSSCSLIVSLPSLSFLFSRCHLYSQPVWWWSGYSSAVDGANSVLCSFLLIFHLVPFTAVTLFTRPLKMFLLPAVFALVQFCAFLYPSDCLHVACTLQCLFASSQSERRLNGCRLGPLSSLST